MNHDRKQIAVYCLYFVIIRRSPRATRTDTLFPNTTLCRSLPIAVCQGALSADPGADEAGGALAKPVRKADAGIRDRLARRHEGKLRKPVQHAELALLEMRSEEHTSELQSLMRISYDVFCFKKKTKLLLTTLLSST